MPDFFFLKLLSVFLGINKETSQKNSTYYNVNVEGNVLLILLLVYNNNVNDNKYLDKYLKN